MSPYFECNNRYFLGALLAAIAAFGPSGGRTDSLLVPVITILLALALASGFVEADFVSRFRFKLTLYVDGSCHPLLARTFFRIFRFEGNLII